MSGPHEWWGEDEVADFLDRAREAQQAVNALGAGPPREHRADEEGFECVACGNCWPCSTVTRRPHPYIRGDGSLGHRCYVCHLFEDENQAHFLASMDEANERMGATLAALRAVLLHPPAGASDVEILAAARMLARQQQPPSPDNDIGGAK